MYIFPSNFGTFSVKILCVVMLNIFDGIFKFKFVKFLHEISTSTQGEGMDNFRRKLHSQARASAKTCLVLCFNVCVMFHMYGITWCASLALAQAQGLGLPPTGSQFILLMSSVL